MNDQDLTPVEVAERLRVSKNVVLAHIRERRLKAYVVGGGKMRPRYRIRVCDFHAFKADQCTVPPVAMPAFRPAKLKKVPEVV